MVNNVVQELILHNIIDHVGVIFKDCTMHCVSQVKFDWHNILCKLKENNG